MPVLRENTVTTVARSCKTNNFNERPGAASSFVEAADKKDICMKHVRMWIRGDASEVDCAWTTETSGALLGSEKKAGSVSCYRRFLSSKKHWNILGIPTDFQRNPGVLGAGQHFRQVYAILIRVSILYICICNLETIINETIYIPGCILGNFTGIIQ